MKTPPFASSFGGLLLVWVSVPFLTGCSSSRREAPSWPSSGPSSGHASPPLGSNPGPGGYPAGAGGTGQPPYGRTYEPQPQPAGATSSPGAQPPGVRSPAARPTPLANDGKRLGSPRIQQVLRTKKDAYANCYAQGVVEDRRIHGTVVMHITIGADGLVLRATGKPPTDGSAVLRSPHAIGCIEREIYGLAFPPTNRGMMPFRYPLAFQVTR